MIILSYTFYLEDSYEWLHKFSKISRLYLNNNYLTLKNVLKQEPKFMLMQRLLDLPYKVIKS